MRLVKHFAKLTACLSASLLLLGCEPSVKPPISPTASVPAPLSLSRAIYSERFVLDPLYATVSADTAPLRDLLAGLMRFDPQGNPIPDLAQNLFSDDGKIWLVILNERQWSNGEPITAEDIVKSWQRLADPATASPLAPYLTYLGIENAKAILAGEKAVSELGVSALNPQTLQIQLSHPNYLLPKMLAHIALLPTYQGKNPSDQTAFISSGDYRLVQQTTTRLELAATSPLTTFQRVQYHLINSAQNPQAFDLIENPLLPYAGELISLPRLCGYFYGFNFADPQMSQKTVREVIQSMINVNSPAPLYQRNRAILPKPFYQAYPSPYASSTLEQRLAQMGIGQSNRLTLKIAYDDRQPHSQIASQLMRNIGQTDLIRLRPQALDWQSLQQIRQTKQFQLIRSGWCADYPDPVAYLAQFHSASVDNGLSYRNPLVDQSLEQLISQPLSEQKRQQLVQLIVQQLQNDVAILPLFQYQRLIGRNAPLLGIDPNNPSEVIYSKDLSLKKDNQ